MISDNCELKQRPLKDFHNSLLGGYARSLQTYMRMATQFFWKGMHHDVQDYVQKYLICQQAKALTIAHGGLLQPLSIP